MKFMRGRPPKILGTHDLQNKSVLRQFCIVNPGNPEDMFLPNNDVNHENPDVMLFNRTCYDQSKLVIVRI